MVAFAAVPVALYLRLRLASPLAALVAVTLGWFLLGAATGTLPVEAAFGVALYRFYFAPFLAGAFALLGGGDYYVRRATSAA